MRIGRLAVVLALAVMAPAMAMADTLATVGQSGVFTIGYRTDAAPFSFETDGQPTGYSVELCAEIGKAVGEHLGRGDLNVVYKPVTAETRFSSIESGKIDILCGATTKTLGRSERVGFTQLTFVTGASLLSMDSDKVPSVASLKGKRVMITLRSASPGTSTPCQKLSAPSSMERGSWRKFSSIK